MDGVLVRLFQRLLTRAHSSEILQPAALDDAGFVSGWETLQQWHNYDIIGFPVSPICTGDYEGSGGVYQDAECKLFRCLFRWIVLDTGEDINHIVDRGTCYVREAVCVYDAVLGGGQGLEKEFGDDTKTRAGAAESLGSYQLVRRGRSG